MIRKYKGTELYLLPPAIFPHEPLDTMDQRFMNYSHAPITSPLQRPLQIQAYNDTFIIGNHPSQSLPITTPSPSKPSQHLPIAIHQPSKDTPHSTVDLQAFQEHNVTIPKFHTTIELFSESKTTIPLMEDQLIAPVSTPTVQSITDSKDSKLFFIQFPPNQTLQARWYLVQIDMQSTIEINKDLPKDTSSYFCMFLAKHPSDSDTSDEFSMVARLVPILSASRHKRNYIWATHLTPTQCQTRQFQIYPMGRNDPTQ